jgi:homoserine kinase
VIVPATSANLGPGFDCMGLALSLFNEITVETGVPFSVEIEGESAGLLPRDRSNTVVAAMDTLLDLVQSPLVPRNWKVKCKNQIPVGSGLGSSASAIVGGLLLANALVEWFHPERRLSPAEVLRLAIEMEGHPDNVTPAMLGGGCLSCADGAEVRTFPLPIPDHWRFVIAVPFFKLMTEESRRVLPKAVNYRDAVYNVAQAARLTLALATGNLSLLKGGFGDRLHEPYRESLIPGYEDVRRAALQAGAVATTLSGAGPSILAWCEDQGTAWQVADQMTLAWREHNVPCRCDVLTAWKADARVRVDCLT